MTGQSSWRSLQSVMLLTIHVAAIAYVIRSFTKPTSLTGLLIWVPVTILVAVFLSLPIGRAIASAFDPASAPVDRTCPRCRRGEIRPLIRSGTGLFQPVTGYRCAACWTIFRSLGNSRMVEQATPEAGPIDPTGIAFLSDPLSEQDLRFLDEETESPGKS